MIRHGYLTAMTVALSSLALRTACPAQSLAMTWYTIDCGGGFSLVSSPGSSGLQLTGTIGQPDTAIMIGGAPGTELEFIGGFWAVYGGAAAPICPADLDHSGDVNAADLAIILGAWSIPPGAPACQGNVPCAADLDANGLVNAADLALLLGGWGPCT